MKRLSKKKFDAIVEAKDAIADFDLNHRDLEFAQWHLSNLEHWR